jgi:hypothetical protein
MGRWSLSIFTAMSERSSGVFSVKTFIIALGLNER